MRKTTLIALSGLLILGSLSMVAGTAAAETTDGIGTPTVPGQIDQDSSDPSNAELQEAVEEKLEIDLQEDTDTLAAQAGPASEGADTFGSTAYCEIKVTVRVCDQTFVVCVDL